MSRSAFTGLGFLIIKKIARYFKEFPVQVL